MKETLKEGVLLAIEAAGSQTELAKIAGTKQQNVYSWIHVTGKIPSDLVMKIENGLDGKITRWQMRPDVFPTE